MNVTQGKLLMIDKNLGSDFLDDVDLYLTSMKKPMKGDRVLNQTTNEIYKKKVSDRVEGETVIVAEGVEHIAIFDEKVLGNLAPLCLGILYQILVKNQGFCNYVDANRDGMFLIVL